MNVNTGKIGTEEEIKSEAKEFERILPVNKEHVQVMRKWGKKKRVRYAELLDMGYTNSESFDCVENHQGKLR